MPCWQHDRKRKDAMTSMEDAMKKAGFRPKQQKRRDRGSGGSSRPPLPKFPDSYFKTDDQGRSYLQPAFVSKGKVDPWAKCFADDRLTTGQIRRFFNHCREIERRLKVDGESWHQVSAGFEALCYHAQNAFAARKIPREFQNFIDENVKRVVAEQEPRRAFLDGFLPHFEALVGFGAAYMKEK